MGQKRHGTGLSLLDLLFFTGFAFFVCHELDAVAQSEWRLLPGLASLDDETARRAFVGLHAPVFALLMWGASNREARLRRLVHQCFDAFTLLHAVLHSLLWKSELHTFDSALSQACIFGAGVVGLVHGVLTLAAGRPGQGTSEG